MRLFAVGLSVYLLCTHATLLSQEPTPSAERIAELVRELGSEDFAKRELATKRLAEIGLACKTQLELARDSSDPEVRQRAERVLHSLDGLVAYEAFLVAMAGPWETALKEGRLVGPLAGVTEGRGAFRKLPDDLGGGGWPGEGAADPGLAFLARTQSTAGNWRPRAYGAQVSEEVAQTSLALMAFLGAGHTEKVGQYKGSVRAAVAWLKSCQLKDGAILGKGWKEADRAAHALASMALAEAAGMANVQDTKKAAQEAVNFIIRQQDKKTGGFGRKSGLTPDLFTTCLHVMALKSAKVAGMRIPHEAFEGVIRFLDSVEEKEGKTYRFVLNGKPSPQAAVLGLVCRQLLGWKKEDLSEGAAAALKELGEPTVDRGESDVLTNYLGTLLAFRQGGPIWKNWNKALKRNLLNGQIKKGPAGGGWAAKGVWVDSGQIFSSALNCLALEVYYRYLPMYK